MAHAGRKTGFHPFQFVPIMRSRPNAKGKKGNPRFSPAARGKNRRGLALRRDDVRRFVAARTWKMAQESDFP